MLIDHQGRCVTPPGYSLIFLIIWVYRDWNTRDFCPSSNLFTTSSFYFVASSCNKYTTLVSMLTPESKCVCLHMYGIYVHKQPCHLIMTTPDFCLQFLMNKIMTHVFTSSSLTDSHWHWCDTLCIEKTVKWTSHASTGPLGAFPNCLNP